MAAGLSSLGSVPDEVVGLHFKTVMYEKLDIFKHFKITVRCPHCEAYLGAVGNSGFTSPLACSGLFKVLFVSLSFSPVQGV